MIKRKRVMSALLTAAVSLGMIGITSNTAYAGVYNDVSFESVTGEDRQATDSNGVTWNYIKYNDGTICINGTRNVKTVMEIPSKLDGYTVTGINQLLGYENRLSSNYGQLGNTVKKVIIPSGVKVIGVAAFARCANLTEIQIPNSVNIIGGGAFNVKWLEANRNSNGFVIVNGILIDGHKASGNVIIPSGIRCIADSAFDASDDRFPNYKNITSVSIPSSVKRIGKNAFLRCNLTKAEISEGVEVIASGAFSQCSQLVEAKIPNSAKELASDAFQGDYSLKSVSAGNANGNVTVKVPQGWHKDGEHWYWSWSDGSKRNGWYDENGKRYYFYGNGQMATEFIDLNGYSYYFQQNPDGKAPMVTGWRYINGYWFYFNTDPSGGLYGAMKRASWAYIDGDWYYFYYNGTMAYNTTIDGYYINSSGAWVR